MKLNKTEIIGLILLALLIAAISATAVLLKTCTPAIDAEETPAVIATDSSRNVEKSEKGEESQKSKSSESEDKEMKKEKSEKGKKPRNKRVKSPTTETPRTDPFSDTVPRY